MRRIKLLEEEGGREGGREGGVKGVLLMWDFSLCNRKIDWRGRRGGALAATTTTPLSHHK
jgi:hypothetical protein